MPRSKRLNIPGALYHVIVRGLERRRIFIDDEDRNHFVERLKAAVVNTKSQCYAWVLMPNHIHLLIRVGGKSLSDLMRSLLTGYAVYFNRTHRRHGYLYQNRYKSILCQEDAYLLKLLAYIHLNPIKGKIVKNMEELNNYQWSGHAALSGKTPNNWQAVKEVLLYFGKSVRDAREQYRVFIRDNAETLMNEDLLGGGLRRSAGGWRQVEALRRKKVFWRGDEQILGDGNFVNMVLEKAEEKLERKEILQRKGWDLNRLITYVCEISSLQEDDLRKKGRGNNIARAKGLLCYWAHNEIGVSGAALASYLGISRQAVYKIIAIGERVTEGKRLS